MSHANSGGGGGESSPSSSCPLLKHAATSAFSIAAWPAHAVPTGICTLPKSVHPNRAYPGVVDWLVVAVDVTVLVSELVSELVSVVVLVDVAVLLPVVVAVVVAEVVAELVALDVPVAVAVDVTLEVCEVVPVDVPLDVAVVVTVVAVAVVVVAVLKQMLHPDRWTELSVYHVIVDDVSTTPFKKAPPFNELPVPLYWTPFTVSLSCRRSVENALTETTLPSGADIVHASLAL